GDLAELLRALALHLVYALLHALKRLPHGGERLHHRALALRAQRLLLALDAITLRGLAGTLLGTLERLTQRRSLRAGTGGFGLGSAGARGARKPPDRRARGHTDQHREDPKK